ncbi:MAG: hypothetical protein ACPG4N_03525 [Gammaproteobacteria bacterium]
MSDDQRSVLTRRVVEHEFEKRDPKQFDHWWAIGLAAVLIIAFEFIF